MFRLISNRWLQVIILILLLGEAVAIRLNDPPVVQRWRQLTFDAYNKLMPRSGGEGMVVIVDIDEDSLRKYGQWPWPRTMVAEIPEKLTAMGAKVVGFDIVFAEADRTSPGKIAEGFKNNPDMQEVAEKLKSLPDNDEVFAQKILKLNNVVTGFVAANQKTDALPLQKSKILNEGIRPAPEKFVTAVPYFTVSLPKIVAAAKGNGSFTVAPEKDGIVRNVPLLLGHKLNNEVTEIYPALSLEMLRVLHGKNFYKVKSFGQRNPQGYGIQNITLGDYNIPTDMHGRFQVYYAGHRPELYIPAWQLLEGKVSADKIKDKVVLVGTSAIGLLDLRSSPLDAALPGVEIHAEIIEQIMSGQFLRRPNFFDGAELIVTVSICLFIIFLAPFIGTGVLAMLGALLIATGGFGSVYIYQHFGYLLDPVYPSMIIIMIFMLSSVLTNLRTEMERRAIRNAFGHYISKPLIDELATNPDKLKLGGEVRELSVMFSDIRNFTSISEKMAPEDIIKLMNDFLTPMTTCVMDNRGTVDKYMGDAIMAFWNAPVDDKDHARNACTAALQMMDAMKVFNKNFEEQAKAEGNTYMVLSAGIGIHSGACSVGNMGSKQRFAYSALGDTVNLASRLEGQTKQYGVSIIISEDTYKQAPEFAVIEVDLLTVKGRTKPVRVYTLLGDAEMANSREFKEFKTRHDSMLTAYRSQNWDKAVDLLRRCNNKLIDSTGLYTLYSGRIEQFKENPPPSNWEGVWVAKEK